MDREIDESLADYRERWYHLLPLSETSAWSATVSQEELEGIAREVLGCTCDLAVLMTSGCRCGTMKQEREANRSTREVRAR